MLCLIHSGSRSTVLASLVLTLTLVSDAVLYLLLPLFFDSFGLTVLWVGILLSANRFVRLFVNPWLVPWFQYFGPRTALLQAVVLASLASLSFVVLFSPWTLLLARLLWGCAYALIRLACLHYATEEPERRMINLGWYTSIQEMGPLLVILITPMLVVQISAQAVLFLAFVLCLLALVPAFALPAQQVERGVSTGAQWPWPDAWHRLTFLLCLLFDGVWTVILAPLLVATGWSIPMALTITSALLVSKRIYNTTLGLLTVRFDIWRHDRFWLVIALGLMLLATGLMAMQAILTASVLATVGHGIFMILVPKLLSDRASTVLERQQTLNTFTFWRDLAAAVGALLASLLIAWQSAPEFYAVGGMILLGLSIALYLGERHRSFFSN